MPNQYQNEANFMEHYEGTIVAIFADDGRKFKSLYVNQNVFTESEFEKVLKEAKMLTELPFDSFG